MCVGRDSDLDLESARSRMLELHSGGGVQSPCPTLERFRIGAAKT
jgi:hypothetical protein